MNKNLHLFRPNRGPLLHLLVLLIACLLAAEALAANSSTDKMQAPASVSGSPVPDKDLIQCLRKGHEALDKTDLDEAAKLFHACVEQHPKSGLAHYWLGQSYFLAHKKVDAIAEFKEAVRLEPANPYAMHALGRVYSLDKTKLDLAEDLLSKVLTIDPHFEDARFDLARVYAQKGALDKAFQLFSQIIKQEMKFAVYHTEVGRILTALGQEKGAKEEYKRALILYPKYEPARKLLQELENKQQPREGEKAPTPEKKPAEKPTPGNRPPVQSL
ncbi:MAG: tetratricopeptide repeat protein [Desulfomonilaceae bacterium]